MGEREHRLALVSLGCKLNRTESESIVASLVAGGWEAGAAGEAAAVLIDTCTVTSEADHKVRKAVRRALRDCPGPVVVTGCAAAVGGAAIAALDPRVAVEADKSAVPELVARLTGGPEPQPGTRAGAGLRARAGLKVQDGCDVRCAYCVVPVARGASRSVPLAEILAEARALDAAGVREVVLTGVNPGAYSSDGHDLADVIERVSDVSRARVRLSSVEPLHLTGRLLATLAERRVCEHLHVPLQSGADRVLAAMGRGYTAREYADALARARSAVPGLAVTTDVMAGFPGETAEDAARTLRFVEECGFAKMHVFRYSRRPGTAAASATDQVPPQVGRARAADLSAAGERMRSEWLAAKRGTVAQVLVERADGGECQGTTRDYAKVRFVSATAGAGDIAELVLGESVRVW